MGQGQTETTDRRLRCCTHLPGTWGQHLPCLSGHSAGKTSSACPPRDSQEYSPSGPGPTPGHLDGLEFRGPNIPLRKREEKLFFTQSRPTKRGPGLGLVQGGTCLVCPHLASGDHTCGHGETLQLVPRPMRSRKATCGSPQS